MLRDVAAIRQLSHITKLVLCNMICSLWMQLALLVACKKLVDISMCNENYHIRNKELTIS
jgi:hypothetical protein